MKNLLYTLFMCICLTSCQANKYEYEIRLANNDSIVESGIAQCYERWGWEGQDTHVEIHVTQVTYNDTCKMLYKAIATSGDLVTYLGKQYDSPLKVTKFKYIKEENE